MENYEAKLKEAAKEQIYANFYDVHILSPLLAPGSMQSQSKEDKKNDNFTVRLPSCVRNELTKISEQEGISITQLINNAIANSIVKHHDQEKARQIYLEAMLKWKNEPSQISPLRMKDLQRMSRDSNPLRTTLQGGDDE